MTYEPKPIDTSKVQLPEKILDLGEQLIDHEKVLSVWHFFLPL